MVKENIIIPKENLAQVEEVREIENTEQQQKKLDEKQENKPSVAEDIKESVVPTVHASDDEEEVKEGLKNLHGGAIVGSGAAVGTATLNPGLETAASGTMAGIFKGLGKIEKGIGEITDSRGLKESGEVHDEGSTKAIEGLGKKISGN